MVKEPNKVAIQDQVDVTKSTGGVLDYAFNWTDVISAGETISFPFSMFEISILSYCQHKNRFAL